MTTIDAAYLRKSRTPRERARGLLADAEIAELCDARKAPAGPRDLTKLFAGRKRLFVGKGKAHTVHRLTALADKELHALVLGTTGNLRAPTLLVGDAVVVGFTPAMYEEVLA